MTWAPCPHGVRTRGKKLPSRPHQKYIGSRAFLDCTALKMATLWLHDPGHGIHPWMKTCFDHSYRGLAVTHQESGRAP